jgi:tRNA (guanosine-2'-O-)-methyltransferase
MAQRDEEILKEEITDYLRSFVAETRLKRFEEVLENRTGQLRIVLENIYQAHNASAVLRTCDCFGVQNVHFIENRNSLKISDEIALGSSNWLTVHRHTAGSDNTRQALQQLKDLGYRIVVTSPHTGSIAISDLPVDGKVALVFGTELEGVTEEALSMADEFVKVPMFGFTESFNISVCAAICMYDITTRMRSGANRYGLTDDEKKEVMFAWLKNTVRSPDALIRDFLDKKKS